MNQDRSLDRLAEILDELAGTGRTDYLPAIVERAAAVRQRPVWRFPGRWLPMPTRMPNRGVAVALLTILLIAALVVGALVGSRRQHPPPFGPAGNGRIAYASNGEIYVVDRPDSTPRVLVTGPESDNIPIFSPSGDRIAFLRHPDPTGTFGDFYLMTAMADGSGVRRLSGLMSGLNGIAWSPDDTSIAFGNEIGPARRAGIVLYPVTGAAPMSLDLGVPAESLSWRPPDGTELAFLGLVDGKWTLHVADRDGANVRDLGIEAQAAVWSPDGKRLVFDRVEDSAAGSQRRSLHVADVDANGALIADRALEFDPRNDIETGGNWSPDGQWLAFVRGRDDRFVVAIGRPDGTGYREVGVETGPPDSSQNSVWMWSPDGRWVIQTFDDGPTWIFDPEGGPPRRAAFDVAAFTNWQRVAP